MKAEQFRLAGSMFPGQRVGLSASALIPQLTKLYTGHIGEVIYTDLSQPVNPEVVFLHTPIYLDSEDFRTRYYYPDGTLRWEAPKPSITAMDTHISENRDKNTMIFWFIQKLFNESTRHIIVIGKRVEQLKNLYTQFSKLYPYPLVAFLRLLARRS